MIEVEITEELFNNNVKYFKRIYYNYIRQKTKIEGITVFFIRQ